MLLFVSTGLSGAKGISFPVLRILLITLYSELRFRWSCTLWKACEIIYKILLKIISLDQRLSTGVTGDHRMNLCFQKSDFIVLRILVIILYSELWLMILYSMESLWNDLQDSAEDQLIWPKFEHRCNRWSSDEPVLPEISFHIASYFGHNSLLRTPILMILYSMKILWNALKDSAEDQLIWSKFENRCNRW